MTTPNTTDAFPRNAEAGRLLHVHGRNELEEKSKSWYRLYAEQFVEPMVRGATCHCLFALPGN